MRYPSILFGFAIAVVGVNCSRDDHQIATVEPGAQLAHTQSGPAPLKPNAAGYQHVPGGVLVHQDCIHQVPNGATVDASGNVSAGGQVVATYPACTHPMCFRGQDQSPCLGSDPPAAGGWVDWSTAPAINIDGLSEFNELDSGTFQVPAPPLYSLDGQLIYMFPSLESIVSSEIVQPVLQWGQYCNGSECIGSYYTWTYAAWAVTSTGAFYSSGISVSESDVLDGQIILTSSLHNTFFWTITAKDTTTGQQTSLNAAILAAALNIANSGVLEAYSINSCNDFPDQSWTYFGAPTLVAQAGPGVTNYNQVTPTWTACSFPPASGCGPSGYSGPSCNFGASIYQGGVTVNY